MHIKQGHGDQEKPMIYLEIKILGDIHVKTLLMTEKYVNYNYEH